MSEPNAPPSLHLRERLRDALHRERRFLANSLYGITPLDRPTFAASGALMFLMAIAASYLPARRATKVDPLVALRAE